MTDHDRAKQAATQKAQELGYADLADLGRRTNDGDYNHPDMKQVRAVWSQTLFPRKVT